MKFLLFLLPLFLLACEERGRMTVECYDKSDKLVFKEIVSHFEIEAAIRGSKTNVHTCIITGESQDQ